MSTCLLHQDFLLYGPVNKMNFRKDTNTSGTIISVECRKEFNIENRI